MAITRAQQIKELLPGLSNLFGSKYDDDREAQKEQAAEEIDSMTLIYPGGFPDGTVPEIESTPSTVHVPKNDLPSRRTEGKTHLIAAMREGLLVAQDMEEELVLELLHHVGRVAMAVAQSDNDAADLAAQQAAHKADERYKFGVSDPLGQMQGAQNQNPLGQIQQAAANQQANQNAQAQAGGLFNTGVFGEPFV
jgi:hypothetical protein